MTDSQYAVRVLDVDAVSLAVVKDTAHAGNIGPRIMEGLPKVEAHLKALGLGSQGPSVVVYLPDTAAPCRWDVPPGIPVEIGVQLSGALPHDSPRVVRSSTPAGRVATTTHFGSYDRLGEAHRAIHDWCREHAQHTTLRNWEVYGEWSDDPAKRRTDVYYLLEA